MAGPDTLDDIRALWEGLHNHHIAISPCFAAQLKRRTFAERKAEWLAKADQGQLRIDVCLEQQGNPIGYCISSMVGEAGEIDSIFVQRGYRGKGIGSHLLGLALAWLHTMQVKEITVEVLYGNDTALPFYARCGLLPRRVILMEQR